MMGDYSHMFDEIPAIQRKMILDRLTTVSIWFNFLRLQVLT